MPQKKWSFVEIGVLAYVIYSSIGAVIGGIMFLIGGSVMSAMQNSGYQQGLNITAPNIGHVLQAIGGFLVVVGLIGGVASAIYVSRHRAQEASSPGGGSEGAGGVDTSNLEGAVLGLAVAEAASARRRRRLFNGSNSPGVGSGNIGGRPPGM